MGALLLAEGVTLPRQRWKPRRTYTVCLLPLEFYVLYLSECERAPLAAVPGRRSEFLKVRNGAGARAIFRSTLLISFHQHFHEGNVHLKESLSLSVLD